MDFVNVCIYVVSGVEFLCHRVPLGTRRHHSAVICGPDYPNPYASLTSTGSLFFISSSHPLSFLPFFCFLCLSGFFQFPFEGFLNTVFFSSLFFIYRLVLSFPVSRIAGLIQYLAFSHWLLSPSNMHLPFLHVFSRLASFFLVLNNNPPVRMDHSVSVHHLVRDTLTASQCCSDAYRCCKHL